MNIDKTIELKQFKGRHILSGCDFGKYEMKDDSYHQARNTMTFIVDGQEYTVMEDSNDGYRSAMDRIIVGGKCKNKFQEITVVGIWKKAEYYGSNNTIQFIDIENGEIVLEFGTDNYDDYYPMFVNSFYPDKMHINTN